MVPLGEQSSDGFYFVNAGHVAWRPSTYAPMVHVKDLGSANGRSMHLVRYKPGASFPVHLHEG